MKLTLRQAKQLLRSVAAEEITPLELAEILRAFERRSRVSGKQRLARAKALRLVGKLPEAARELEKLIDAGEELAEAHGTLGSVYRAQGRPLEALRHKEKALALAPSAMTLGEVGTALAALGRLREARTKHEQALAKIRAGKGSKRDEGRQLSYLGVALHRAGRWNEARRAHRAALAMHRAIGNRRLEGAELMHLGHVEREAGDVKKARRLFEQAERTLRDVGDRALEGVVLGLRGALEVEAGRPEIAGPLLHEALAIHREAGSPRHEATTLLHLALHQMSLGEDARRTLERARDLGEGRVEPEQHAWVLALLGDFRAIELEDPATQHAIEILKGMPRKNGIDGSRIRVAIALRKTGVRIADDASWFEADGVRVDLVRRGPLRLCLARLMKAKGRSVPWQEVLEAGWPGEKVLAEAGFARVRNAMFQLRKLGLKNALRTTSDGYRIDVTDR